MSWCPSSDVGIGPNTHVSVTFDRDIDPDSMVEISCDGQPVAGAVSVEGSTLHFSPSAPFVVGSACTANVASGTANDGSVLTGEWEFAVGTEPSYQWRFGATELAYTSPGGLLWVHEATYRDGRLLVLFSRGGSIYLAISADDGATFSVVEADPVPEELLAGPGGLVEDAELAYANGRAHIVWRFLPYNTRQSEIFYVHSTSTLDTLSTPAMISTPFDGMAAFDPRVQTGPDGTVQLSWAEKCGDECYEPLVGIYLSTFLSDGDLPGPTAQIVNDEAIDPRAVWVNHHLLMTWIAGTFPSPYTNVLWDQTAGATVGGWTVSGAFLWPDKREFLTLDGNTAVLHWMEGGYGFNFHAYYLARYDATTQTMSEPQELYIAPDTPYDVSRLDSSADGTLVWTLALGSAPTTPGGPRPTHRVVRRSQDTGVTFRSATELSFLRPSGAFDGDDFIPSVAVGMAGDIFVIWARDDDNVYTLHSSKGTLAPSCSPSQ